MYRCDRCGGRGLMDYPFTEAGKRYHADVQCTQCRGSGRVAAAAGARVIRRADAKLGFPLGTVLSATDTHIVVRWDTDRNGDPFDRWHYTETRVGARQVKIISEAVTSDAG